MGELPPLQLASPKRTAASHYQYSEVECDAIWCHSNQFQKNEAPASLGQLGCCFEFLCK